MFTGEYKWARSKHRAVVTRRFLLIKSVWMIFFQWEEFEEWEEEKV